MGYLPPVSVFQLDYINLDLHHNLHSESTL